MGSCHIFHHCSTSRWLTLHRTHHPPECLCSADEFRHGCASTPNLTDLCFTVLQCGSTQWQKMEQICTVKSIRYSHIYVMLNGQNFNKNSLIKQITILEINIYILYIYLKCIYISQNGSNLEEDLPRTSILNFPRKVRQLLHSKKADFIGI